MISSILLLGVSGLGIAGFYKANVFANIESAQAAEIQAPVTTLTAAPATVQQDSIDYSRPATSNNFAINSGGPVPDTEMSEEDEALAAELRTFQATTNPAFVPNMWAHMGKINNEFGFRRNPFGGRTYEFHGGMDIDGERGDIVVAPANGTVLKSGWQGGYGNMIEIDHGNGLTSRYGHLSKIDVQVGDTIQRGQLIAFVGSTGRSTGPHLHYEIRMNDKPINPRHFLPPEPTELQKPGK